MESITSDGITLAIYPESDQGSRLVVATAERTSPDFRDVVRSSATKIVRGATLDECMALASDLADRVRRMLAAGAA